MSEAFLRLHLTPRASRNEIAGWRGDVLHIKVTAPPADNAANDALVKFIAHTLGIRKSQVALVSGAKSREKTLKITGLSDGDLRSRFAPATED